MLNPQNITENKMDETSYVLKREPQGNRGQIEIMGLLVIVVLLSIGVYLFLVFGAKGALDRTPEIKSDKLSADYALALLNTQIGCSGGMQTVQQLLVDCASVQGLSCGGSSSCEALNNTIKKTLDNTLNAWNYKYYLVIERPMYSFRNKCQEDDEHGMNATIPIPITSTGLSTKVTIAICS
jgi:hypothetical protein